MLGAGNVGKLVMLWSWYRWGAGNFRRLMMLGSL